MKALENFNNDKLKVQQVLDDLKSTYNGLKSSDVFLRQEFYGLNQVTELNLDFHFKTNVLRDGKWELLAARELVPGDIIELIHGDTVPADVILIEGSFLKCEEWMIHKYYSPVVKSTLDKAYYSSTVLDGKMLAVVEKIGLNTMVGSIVKFLSNQNKTTKN